MLRDGIDIGRDIAANDRRPELALASIRNRILDADGIGRRIIRSRYRIRSEISAQMIDLEFGLQACATQS